MFPNIVRPNSFEGKITKYDAMLLIPKLDKNQVAKVEKAVQKLLIENENKALWTEEDKLALKDGDNSQYTTLHHHYTVKANSSKKIPCVWRNREHLDSGEVERTFVNGSCVNAVISFWYQDNDYGNRVNCNLEALQFVKSSDGLIGDPTSAFGTLGEAMDIDDSDLIPF